MSFKVYKTRKPLIYKGLSVNLTCKPKFKNFKKNEKIATIFINTNDYSYYIKNFKKIKKI